jgi:hypothetical protein
MSVTNTRPRVAYGISTALLDTPPMPIVSPRAPTTRDKAPIGQLWVFKPSNLLYILSSIVNNAANWVALASSGGSGVFSSVTATTGNITATLGNIVASAGSVSAATTVDAGTSMAATTSITAGTSISAGSTVTATTNVIAGMQVIAGTTLQANGDTPGTTGISMSSVTDNTQSSGALTILSPTATSHTNTGLIKFYVGATEVYVPYFATIT